MVKISEQGNPSNYYIVPPLKKIKKKGLWIAFGEGHKYEAQYKDGKLLTHNGEPYEGEGVKKKEKTGKVKIKNLYLKKTVAALNKITLAEKEIGTDVIKTLQNSKFKFTIIEKSNKFTANQKGEKLNYRINNACANFIKSRGGELLIKKGVSDTIGSGGMICWSGTQQEIISNKGIKQESSKICLAHEVFHGYDANFGDLDKTRIGKGIAVTEVCEGRAVYFCNKLRSTKTFSKKYLRLRYYKNDLKYNLLTEDGKLIYFPAPSENMKK